MRRLVLLLTLLLAPAAVVHAQQPANRVRYGPTTSGVGCRPETGDVFTLSVAPFTVYRCGPAADQWSPIGGISDHGGLFGLADDDHPQYFNQARGDVRYYTRTQLDLFLAAKAAVAHAHAIGDTTGLQAALDAKAAAVHAHAEATAGASGFMSAGDKAKLDGVADGATANSTDALLRDRSTHTGTQAVSTVTGLQAALDAKASQVSLDAHAADTSNPHAVTKAQVGLGSADNTSDDDKPVSTAQAAALDAKVDENPAITGATKTRITYDSKGLVTAGADATTADINDSADRRYVTDAQRTVLLNTSGTNTGDQTNIAGNAATATALASDPADCSANQFATGIAASGNLTCLQASFSNLSGSVTDAQVPNNITVDLATLATTATTANSGDSATAFFSAGTIEAARLGSGTASSTTFLRGDSTWATPAGGSPGGSSGDIQYNNAGAFGGLASTGTGNVVRATSPTLTTPNIGAATATSVTTANGRLANDGVNGGLIIQNNIGGNSNATALRLILSDGSTSPIRLSHDTAAVDLGSGVSIKFANAAGAVNTKDVAIRRSQAGVVGFSLGGTSDTNGQIQTGDPGTKPTCSAANRGLHWIDFGGAGVADTYEVCLKDASDAYVWRALP